MITLGGVAASRRCASTFFVKAIGVFVAASRIDWSQPEIVEFLTKL
jgi:hypothetical protein